MAEKLIPLKDAQKKKKEYMQEMRQQKLWKLEEKIPEKGRKLLIQFANKLIKKACTSESSSSISLLSDKYSKQLRDATRVSGCTLNDMGQYMVLILEMAGYDARFRHSDCSVICSVPI